MANLQVKGMHDGLYKALAARAAQENRSISQQVVLIIQEYLSRPSGAPAEATRAFLELAGTWEDDRDAESIVTELRQTRRTGRRFREDDIVLD